VSLKIYNVAGQLVRTLVDEQQAPNTAGLAVTWEGVDDAGREVASGVYFYRLVTKSFTQTKKMVFLK
jgi:flagellar hook assembly protein FlgD